MKNPSKISSNLLVFLLRLIHFIPFYRTFSFEKAYCLYRLNRSEEALQLINEESDHTSNFKELKAQILYKLEK